MTAAAQPAGNTGLQTLMTDGLRIYGIRPMPTTLGQQLLRAANPDYLIGRLVEKHTVNGYTAHAALCKTLEDNLRCLHRHAREDMPSDEHAWLTVDGMEFAVKFDEDADAWPQGALAGVWVGGKWHYPPEVLAPAVCAALDEAAAKWRPES